ncbi:uncharacterized protein KIAA2012-like [Centruroides vittatus]|uniref:uncharacterized protein KIAA2012-like n=1 Tax=Centruroides vittatus TaxID=120091 RepID=UPI003510256A
MASEKKTRFRFTDAERLEAIQELFNNICKHTSKNKNELWQNVHFILCQGNPRFKFCSLRLLKEHMLDQVKKFKKYTEDTESGRERLNTKWGIKMHDLMTVWQNYEQIVEADAISKLNKTGRPRMDVVKRKQADVEIAKEIPDATSGVIHENATNSEDKDDCVLPDNTVLSAQTTLTQLADSNNFVEIQSNNGSNESQDAIEPLPQDLFRKHTESSRKSRNKETKGVWQYLAEKIRCESEIQLQIHRDNIELKREELQYKRQKLEFEQEKWKVEMEERKQQMQVTESLCKVLMAFANSKINKACNSK